MYFRPQTTDVFVKIQIIICIGIDTRDAYNSPIYTCGASKQV